MCLCLMRPRPKRCCASCDQAHQSRDELRRLVTKRVGKDDKECGTEMSVSAVSSCVPRLDCLSARVCRADLSAALITHHTSIKYLTPRADSQHVSLSGLTDIMVGGRSLALYRMGSDKVRGKLSRVLTALFDTEGSKIRSMKRFSPQRGEKSKLEEGERFVESASVDTEVKMEITVSHTRLVTGGVREQNAL